MRALLVSVPMHALLVCALLAIMMAAASAQDPASVDRARVCDKRAREKPLTDEQYRVYMRSCLVSTGPPRPPLETLRTIERRCNAVANARVLTGQDRVSFMAECRSRPD